MKEELTCFAETYLGRSTTQFTLEFENMLIACILALVLKFITSYILGFLIKKVFDRLQQLDVSVLH